MFSIHKSHGIEYEIQLIIQGNSLTSNLLITTLDTSVRVYEGSPYARIRIHGYRCSLIGTRGAPL